MGDVNGREIKIGWRGETPVVDHLTGTEAKHALATVLRQARVLEVHAQNADRQRAQLANVLIALVHRDAARGLVDADGKPVLPMTTTIPKESTDTFKEKWEFSCKPQPDGSLVIVVDRMNPAS